MSRVHTTHSTIREPYQRRRKCAAVAPECSRTQQREAERAFISTTLLRGVLRRFDGSDRRRAPYRLSAPIVNDAYASREVNER